MTQAPPQPPPRVLSTLNADGSRRWLFPRLAAGRFWKRRRIVAYALIVLFNALPWISINGKPTILLDLPRREFTFFGATFLPSDTLLLMLFILAVFVTVFLITALFGRLWCGWACPQTVYMEYLYRPLERLFDGSPDRRRRGHVGAAGLRKVLKYIAFFLVSLHLAHTFLAYFVGAENLFNWTKQSPFEHPTAFLVVAATTGLMMFDFCFFREQVCIVACPYGRFQSVMLDRQSLIISYDEKRGEPRGKARRAKADDVELPLVGDCVDCAKCVVTCPTGIDIREGLQMECIGCAQCIDACDDVMDKLGRSRGLIRYSSQDAMDKKKPRLIRPRVVLYPLVLTGVITLFVVTLVTRAPANVTVFRGSSRPYVTLPDGMIGNEVRIRIVNRSDISREFSFEITGIDGASINCPDAPVTLEPGGDETIAATLVIPPDAFDLGRAQAEITVSDDEDFEDNRRYRLQGPWGPAPAAENQP